MATGSLTDTNLFGPYDEDTVETLVNSTIIQEDYDALKLALDGIRNFRDEFDFVDFVSQNGGKSLPYTDQGSLTRMQEFGFALYRDPNVQAAIEVLISFVVNWGWEFSVSHLKGTTRLVERWFNAIQEVHALMLREASLGVRKGWYWVQSESYKRYLRDGEYFRRWSVINNQLQVRFIEVFDIRQPDSIRQITTDPRSLPVFVQQSLSKNQIYGELGIVASPTDAATEIGYWWRTGNRLPSGEDEFQYLPATEVQHAKTGVDDNDPRGVPAFYSIGCFVKFVHEVTRAMAELAIKQSKYAVVHKHAAKNRRESIKAIASRRATEMNDQEVEGRSQTETHLRGVEIEMHGMKVNARNYTEVIQALQRFVGNVRQIPEFMITGDANVGNRSSLQSAASPFGRRVKRDQQEMWLYDVVLQWDALGRLLEWQPAALNEAKRKVVILPTFPMTEDKDRYKESDTVLKAVTPTPIGQQVISVQEARRRIGVSDQQMVDEIKEERERTPPITLTPAAPPASSTTRSRPSQA